MTHLPPEWAYYHACQCSVLSRDRLDSTGWGREAALDRVVAEIAANANPLTFAETADRAAETAARLERSHASARERDRLVSGDEAWVNPERGIAAASDLRLCISVASRSARDLTLLVNLACGSMKAKSPASGADRAAAMRLRNRLALALAA